MPARVADRQLIDRGSTLKDRHGGYLEYGVQEKYEQYISMSRESKSILLRNKAKSVQTEMKDIIFNSIGGAEALSLPYSRTRSDFVGK